MSSPFKFTQLLLVRIKVNEFGVGRWAKIMRGDINVSKTMLADSEGHWHG